MHPTNAPTENNERQAALRLNEAALRQNEAALRLNEIGFSLIELIVVITIIGILATTVVVSVAGRTDQARATRAAQDIANLSSSCELFRADHGRYPDSLDELRNPPETATGSTISYIKKMSNDPWTNEPYGYDLLDDGPHIYSYGADKTEGGEGPNQDIDNQDDEF